MVRCSVRFARQAVDGRGLGDNGVSVCKGETAGKMERIGSRRWRGGGLLLGLLAVAQCLPTAQVHGGERFQGDIQVLFVTNRAATQPESDAGEVGEPAGREERFGDQRGPRRFGQCRVHFADIPGISSLAGWLPFYLPNQARELAAVQELEEREFWRRLRIGPDGNKPLLGYIHGYNIEFAKSCRRAAVFQAMGGLNGNLVLFSWPSSGQVIQYARDETNIRWSLPEIQRFVRELLAHSPDRQVDLVAHSLGSRGLLDALEQMVTEFDRQSPPIRQLVLVAPDVDAETGAGQLTRIRPLAERITLYVDDSDKPLRLSRELHGYPRLGESGEFLQPPAGVETIDVSEVAAYELSGHLYHLYLPAAIADIRRLLSTGAGAAERPGLERRSINGASYWAIVPED